MPVYFVYTLAGSGDQGVKVLLISSHLIRMSDSKLPSIDVDLDLDFGKRADAIAREESNAASGAGKLSVWTTGHQSIYGNAAGWNLNHEYHEQVSVNDNTVQALEKIRENLIRDYQSKGYAVYQVDFAPDLSLPANYSYYNTGGTQYAHWKLERLSPLSPLWIPYYKKGEIRSKLAGAGSRGGSGGSLTIRSNDKGANNNVKNQPRQKEDNTDWAAVVAMKQAEANAYEAEGDRLSALGALYVMQALEQYKLAQQASPSARVQQKIDGINAQLSLAKSLKSGLDAADNAAGKIRESIDGLGLRRFRALQLSYSGLMVKKPYGDPTPWSTSLTYGFYRILALEAGVYYAQSPVYSLYLTDNNGNQTGQTIAAYQNQGGFTISGGLAMPVKFLVVYAMYGGNLPLDNLSATLVTPGYEYEDVKDDLQSLKWRGMAKLGVHVRVPRSRVAVGLHYALHTIKGDQLIEKDSPYSTVKQGSASYKVGGSAIDKYKFGQFGLSVMIVSK